MRWFGPANNSAFFEAVVQSVEKKPTEPAATAVGHRLLHASGARSFRSEISSAASIWNGAVSNVRLQVTSGRGDFAYYEGSDP